MNIAINGFGRIGRATLKVILEKKNPRIKVVAINDLTDANTLAHLLKYDTSYGKYSKSVTAAKDALAIGGKKYKVLAEKDPAKLPWKELGVDIVLECTGFFRTKEEAGKHIKAGAKKVIIAAPAKDDPSTSSGQVKTFALGVNENRIKKSDKIISNASCTTNCLSPVTEVIRQNFGIKKAVMTTIHSYTADQNIVDGPHKDLRRARAAAVNIVPTTTGAAKATALTIPQLKGKFGGMAIRVPIPVGSICDSVYILNKKVDEKRVNQVIKKASKSARYKGIIDTTDEPLVSSDIVGNSASAIVDLALTNVIQGDMLKIVSWYDNEWGYSNRLAELVEYIIRKRLI